VGHGCYKYRGSSPTAAQQKLTKLPRLARTDFVLRSYRDKPIRMRQAFLAPRPRLNLMTDIFAPSIWKAPIQNADCSVKISSPLFITKPAHDDGLHKPVY
jgi:hypothetical protein